MRRPSKRNFYKIGNKIWRHPSVVALIEDHGNRTDPSVIIRERARALVARARLLGWQGPPFDPRILASLLGIEVHPDQLAPGHDACIFPRGQQLQIVFDATRPATRQNFSISHEISHTLFPDGYELIRNRYQYRATFDPDRELELLCDMGAAEILLPEDEFRADVERQGFGLHAVTSLRGRYQASREATIRRMLRLDQGSSAAIFLEYRLKPSEVVDQRQLRLIHQAAQPRPKLRIAYTAVSENFQIFLPQHKSVPAESCAYRALLSGDVERAREQWDIPNLPMCLVEAMAMPPGDELDASPRAVALLHLSI